MGCKKVPEQTERRYRYAEEYYDKSQNESNSDDENYDNLNVQTINWKFNATFLISVCNLFSSQLFSLNHFKHYAECVM